MSRAIFLIVLVSLLITGCEKKGKPYFLKLSEWRIAPVSSAVTPGLNAIAVTDADDIVKEADYNTSGWIRAVVPGTVLGNLVDNRIYDESFKPDNNGKKNVYFSDNLSEIPPGDFDNQ
ncbi:MAG: hypothetical protein K0B05_14485, partial [Bacteroidales bacterium]|nr:hypothetical protein [Bacteroidales bacterium]